MPIRFVICRSYVLFRILFEPLLLCLQYAPPFCRNVPVVFECALRWRKWYSSDKAARYHPALFISVQAIIWHANQPLRPGLSVSFTHHNSLASYHVHSLTFTFLIPAPLTKLFHKTSFCFALKKSSIKRHINFPCTKLQITFPFMIWYTSIRLR